MFRNSNMKTESGFTLIELMVVVAIIGIILSFSTLHFSRLNQKYRVESTTREIYSLLMKARNNASTTNTRHLAVLSADQVQTGADADVDNNIDGSSDSVQSPQFTIKFTGSPVFFDRRGLATNETIHIEDYSPNITPTMDCIAIFATRINMGRWDGVNNCVHQ